MRSCRSVGTRRVDAIGATHRERAETCQRQTDARQEYDATTKTRRLEMQMRVVFFFIWSFCTFSLWTECFARILPNQLGQRQDFFLQIEMLSLSQNRTWNQAITDDWRPLRNN